MKKIVIVNSLEEAQRVIDVDYPESCSRADDCLTEEDFPCTIFQLDETDWDVFFHKAGLTFREWEEETSK